MEQAAHSYMGDRTMGSQPQLVCVNIYGAGQMTLLHEYKHV
jgi:hypothetical protein